MKRGWILLLAGILLLALVPAVLAAQPENGRPGTSRPAGLGPVFTDPAQPVEVTAGETFRLVLDSNPTTGYRWQIEGATDEAVVKKVHNQYRAPKVMRAGAGGQEVWRFQALKAGTAEIRMIYVRSWEKGVEPARTAVFKVTVK